MFIVRGECERVINTRRVRCVWWDARLGSDVRLDGMKKINKQTAARRVRRDEIVLEEHAETFLRRGVCAEIETSVRFYDGHAPVTRALCRSARTEKRGRRCRVCPRPRTTLLPPSSQTALASPLAIDPAILRRGVRNRMH